MAAPPRSESSRLSHWLLGSALLGLVTALVTVVAVGTQRQVEGEITVEGDREALELRCEHCSDGERVTLDGVEAVFHNQAASLALPGSLPIGLNHFEPRIIGGRWFGDQVVELDIPVHFRLRAATEGLAQDLPTLAVEVEAMDDTAVEVDGRRVPIQNGKGRLDIDLEKDLVGESAAQARFSRTLVYSVRPRNGRAHAGKLEVSYDAPALVVEAPGPSVVIEGSTFALAGRTTPGATLKLDGRPLPVGKDGAFAQMLNVDSVGETTVWLSASAPGLATRRFPIQVKRVQSLDQEAERFAKTASANFARVANNAEDEKGLAVAFEGRLESVRHLGYSTKAILEVSSGCTGTCRAQLTLGSKLKLKENTKVVAYGYVAGTTETPDGSNLPEVRTLYVLNRP